MIAIRSIGFTLLSLGVLAGCSKKDAPKTENALKQPGLTETKPKEPTPEQEAKYEAAIGKLSSVDQPLARAQKFCPIGKSRLGSMGKPERIELDNQPVFLCCSSCEAEARANPKKTLDQVELFKTGMK